VVLNARLVHEKTTIITTNFQKPSDLIEKLGGGLTGAGVPNHVELALAKVLANLDSGTPIHEETYQLVAQILALIWRLDKNYHTKSEG
jgi:type III secretion system FlhB-like substrate exporter